MQCIMSLLTTIIFVGTCFGELARDLKNHGGNESVSAQAFWRPGEPYSQTRRVVHEEETLPKTSRNSSMSY